MKAKQGRAARGGRLPGLFPDEKFRVFRSAETSQTGQELNLSLTTYHSVHRKRGPFQAGGCNAS